MSLKTLLMPVVSQHWLSATRLSRQRARSERQRVQRVERHVVHYFHQVDDPYSALAASILSRLMARYDVDLQAHVVGSPSDAAAPEREKLIAYSRKDAQLLAGHFGLAFDEPGTQPSKRIVEWATGVLVAATDGGRFVELAAQVSSHVWKHSAEASSIPLLQVAPVASPQVVASHMKASNALRERLGHYLGAMFFYAGEWYWGIDRLYHLEQRLQDLGAQKADVTGYLCTPAQDLPQDVPLDHPPPIDFFVSLRSPYSAIVAPRVFALGRRVGAVVRLRYVLPMVMRGLPVPRAKRSYIAQDAAREARARGIPFGRINDPVGRPTERGLALIPYAEREGKGEAYLLSFMHGVWAQGMDAGSDSGLRTIVERAGLSWAQASIALQDQAWRATAEANRLEMADLGLWGVPSFRVDDTAVWGQDRLWVIQDALLKTDKLQRFTE